MLDFDISSQISALQATFDDIRQVVGVDRLRAEIAEYLTKKAAEAKARRDAA